MATSTIPAAIDYLVAAVTALPEAAAPVVVSDGWPTQRSDVGVVIGVTPENADTRDSKTHAQMQLGARTQWEDYTIPCILWAVRAGDGAQKAARDVAFGLFDAIDTVLRTPDGSTLGGVLKSGTALLSNAVMTPTSEAEKAGEGRICEIYFEVICRSRSAA